MNYTGYQFNNKPLAKLAMGCMRFPSRVATAEVIAECVRHDVLYLDTSPCYLYQSDEENCETWVGAAIQGLRDKVILSAKCAVGNGGNEVGDYDPSRGFSITTADQVRKQIEQSLKRLNVDKLDCYQLWAVHSPNLFDEALKPGGWLEGVLKAREEGLFTHLGITGHGDATEMKRWVDSGLFEMVTSNFHLLDTSRLPGIRYAHEHGIAVIAMNPLAGGMLTTENPRLVELLSDLGITTPRVAALQYVMAYPGVTALSGMTSAQEARENIAVAAGPQWSLEQSDEAGRRMEDLCKSVEHLCTMCGYCGKCPQEIWIPGVLHLRNHYQLFQSDWSIQEFKNRHEHWGNAAKADRCTACGACESKCPNSLPISKLMREVMATLGAGLSV